MSCCRPIICKKASRCCSPDPMWIFFPNLFVVTYFIILPLMFYNQKHSPFYLGLFKSSKEKQEIMTDENAVRVQQARKYLSMLNQTRLHAMLRQFEGEDHTHDSDIVISIVTVSRNRAAKQLQGQDPYYLTQVVSKFLLLLHKAQTDGFPYHIRINMCNVDQDPENYDEANEMAQYINMFSRFDRLTLNMDHTLEKEKDDYVFCLRQSLLEKPKYVFLIEDDALPSEDLFPVLRYTLDRHLERKYSRGVLSQAEENIAYVKFYHPERLVGFQSREPERLAELLGYGLIFGTFLTWIFVYLFKDNYSLYCVWSMFVLYVMVVAIAAGRVHLNEFRRLLWPYLTSFVRAPSCCMPAMLFPREGATRVANYLSGVTCGKHFPKDTALDEYLNQNHDINAYLVQPNTFTHIGMYSSIGTQIVDPSVV